MSPGWPPRTTWVVGGGGLLGGALRSELRRRGEELFDGPVVPWGTPDAARRVLERGAADLVTRAAGAGGGWRVAWCAGAGVTGTALDALDTEVVLLARFLDAVARADAHLGGDSGGSVFLASSAGGLYAGSPEPPFTEDHPVVPISAYGHAKVAAEHELREFGRRTGVPVVIGRIANLYGPGQDLRKAQGLVSHICRSHLTGQPVSIYVPLDTVRDYLFVDDCAAMVADLLDRAERSGEGTMVVKIVASQQGTTVGALLGDCHRVLKRTPRVVLGASPNARFQARDLRLRSVVWREIDARSLTTLPAGIKATSTGLLRSIQRGGLAS